MSILVFFFFSSRRRHTRFDCDWSSDVCSSDLARVFAGLRMDPLFNDSTGYVETLATRQLAFRAHGTNGADGWDILGIVVELDVDTVNRDLDLRELWNQEDPFQLAPNYLGAYRARLNANLAVMDGIDGKIDCPLQPDGTHPLTELYLADYQVVDVAMPYTEDSYLEIEQALLQGRPHATCGGRSLNDDAVDTARERASPG